MKKILVVFLAAMMAVSCFKDGPTNSHQYNLFATFEYVNDYDIPVIAVVLEIASPEKTKGVIAVFSTENNNGNSIVIKPKGISVGKNYKVTLDNDKASFNISGFSFANNGILISLNSAMTSELILFEEI